MIGVCGLVFAGLKMPPTAIGDEKARRGAKVAMKGDEAKGRKKSKVEADDTAGMTKGKKENGKVNGNGNGVAKKPDLRRRKV